MAIISEDQNPHRQHGTQMSQSFLRVSLLLELSKATWVVALSAPFSDRISHRSMTRGMPNGLPRGSTYHTWFSMF
jgi:hypothetical protein